MTFNPALPRLYITASSQDLRPNQLLAGSIEQQGLGITFHAENSDVEVTKIIFTSPPSYRTAFGRDIKELRLNGGEYWIATRTETATRKSCAPTDPAASICMIFPQGAFIVQRSHDRTLTINSVLQSPREGAVSGDTFAISLDSSMGAPAVSAVATSNATPLQPYDTAGTTRQIFIGIPPAQVNVNNLPIPQDQPIVSAEHQVVQAPISSSRANVGASSSQSSRTSSATTQAKLPNLYVSLINRFFPKTHQLLAGKTGTDIMGIKLHAENDNVEVTEMLLTPVGIQGIEITKDISALELYRGNDTSPFATATIEGCSKKYDRSDIFCTQFTDGQLVVTPTKDENVFVRPRMKTMEEGATNGHEFAFSLDRVVFPISARVASSKVKLPILNNEGETVAEVILGTDVQGRPLVGPYQHIVYSKISSIKTISNHPTGSPVPVGTNIKIGMFQLSTTGPSQRKISVEQVSFTMNATNVQLGTSDNTDISKSTFKLNGHPCVAESQAPAQTGQLKILCPDLRIQTTAGNYIPLILTTDVNNAMINPRAGSFLQVSLLNLNDPSLGPIWWFDGEYGPPQASVSFSWLDTAESGVFDTSFGS